MDIQTLKDRLTVSDRNKIWAPELHRLGDDSDVPMAALHDLCYDAKNRMLAFRAAWLLEYIAVHHPDRFVTIAAPFLTRLPSQKNPSCQRHFTNILRRVTHPRAPQIYRDALFATSREQVVETVFNWFIDPHTPVAVLANCMDVLSDFSEEFEWIREELKQQIEFLLRDGSPAIQSRGKKVLEKLVQTRNAG
ncbi:hypothetical protein [Parapedobacter sp. 10938]|uniref:hypothetical protein n=1 Tax=Parapedobacter flavus TaxID=3110225 RepID=UPI002DBD52D0|nr:hypothetical protein [Parapedobacter sp. 10938]MEC3881274.1 hypothetical protein [Parapedobacter sp. 10938]